MQIYELIIHGGILAVMVVSIIRRLKVPAFTLSLMICAAAVHHFKYTDDATLISWTNHCLTQSFDTSEEIKLKKWELSLTPDLFVRLRKTYQNGKQEYYSFQLSRFNDIDYLGNTTAGTLQFKTDNDNIISQTYNDPNGDVDDVVSFFNLPVKNMQAERLDSLRDALLYLKNEH